MGSYPQWAGSGQGGVDKWRVINTVISVLLTGFGGLSTGLYLFAACCLSCVVFIDNRTGNRQATGQQIATVAIPYNFPYISCIFGIMH